MASLTFKTQIAQSRATWGGHRRFSIQKVSWRPGFAQAPRASLALRNPIIRHASTSAEAGSSIVTRLRNFFFGTSIILGFGVIYVYVTDTRASVHDWFVIPTLRTLYSDPEEAHEVGNKSLKALWHFGLHPRERTGKDDRGDLAVEVFGYTLQNPIGTSAGIDKHAEIPDPLMALGPAVVEIGGTTPKPQDGNEKPRVFRLPSQNALINRYGLNSQGADHVAARLRRRVREFAYSAGLGHGADAEQAVLNGEAGVPPGSLVPGKLLAINIAKNKNTPSNDVKAVTDDYVYCVERLAPFADILVVNVSSPNTPGLRTLQQSDSLKQILQGVVKAAKMTPRKTKPAVMVKVSPDEDSDEQVAGICEAVWESGVDGVVVGNTTNRRPEPLPHLQELSATEQQHLLEQGGFSGPHLFEGTVALVKKYHKLLEARPKKAEPSKKSREALEKEAKKLKEEIAANKSSPPAATLEDVNSSEHDRLNSILTALEQLPKERKRKEVDEAPKVIFATGGITNGQQALEVLNAGASVAMVYTALVYGGVGTISRIKDEMRDEMKRQGAAAKRRWL